MYRTDPAERLRSSRIDREKALWLRQPMRHFSNETHVYFLDIDAYRSGAGALVELLSEDERARAERFVFSSDRDRFVVCRAALRRLLGSYLSVHPLDVKISFGRYGKPLLAAEHGSLQFNVSHSHGVGAIALAAGRRVGIDIEFIDNDMEVEDIASEVFTVSGAAELRRMSPEPRMAAFFEGWTRKEALLKATGDGLSSRPEYLAAVRAANDRASADLTLVNLEGIDWSLTAFEINEALKGCLAVEGASGTVKFHRFSDTASFLCGAGTADGSITHRSTQLSAMETTC